MEFKKPIYHIMFFENHFVKYNMIFEKNKLQKSCTESKYVLILRLQTAPQKPGLGHRRVGAATT